MSAPRSRRARNQSNLAVVPAKERWIAVVGSVGIVAMSLFLIWAMRPGNFNPGTGGIIHRQPRVTWLLALTAVGLICAVWYPRRPDAKFKNRRRAAGLLSSGVLVVAVLTVVWWGQRWDGIVRTYTPPVTFAPQPTVKPGATTTTRAVPPSTTATTAPRAAATTTTVGATTSST